MKKFLVSVLFLTLFSEGKACADYYPDGDYFNLFTQTIIKDKTYIPFLLNYSSQFYDDGVKRMIPDENIYAWKKFFGNKLDYRETEFLINHMPLNDLEVYKKGNSSNAILKKIGSYNQNSEAIDYLIEAKYLEPYMSIKYVESSNSFYYHNENDTSKYAVDLDREKTISSLVSLYGSAQNPEIKQRYGYQIVRFYHYIRQYEQAIDSFKTFVEPIKLRSVPYYYALDQMAGAQRGLKMNDEANWNFFQVFANAPSRKEGAFVSMKLSDSTSFQNILKRASTPEQKNLAYFLLGYSDYNNPIPNMEKMYEINPDSEILKVMAARGINQLERIYLPDYISVRNYDEHPKSSNENDATTNNSETKKDEEGLWAKIMNFFRNLFGSEKGNDTNSEERKIAGSDRDLLKSPIRIPTIENSDEKSKEYLANFSDFVEKTKTKSQDEFWQIADAYVKFLQKDYDKSKEILASIKTTNPEYQEQITRMKMLNDITSQPRIDVDFENHITKDYPELFTQKPVEKDSTYDYYYYETPTTADFIKDILANRYFIQGEDGKSFLINNQLSDLQYYPDAKLAKKVQEFVNKKNKTALEQNVIMKNVDVQDSDAFFNVIYGDNEMRDGQFEKAKNFYSNASNFNGIPRTEWVYSETQSSEKPVTYSNGAYNGFNNISSLVFGHNVWESFQSEERQSMAAESFISEFPFIKSSMNKLELAEALIQLKKMNTSKSNQLIGNVLYNTSTLGYFRELFIMDIDNSPWSKNDIFRNSVPLYQFYYNSYSWNPAIKEDNFDLAIQFYDKAFKESKDPEQKTRILFQMASAEQGKYYQWESKQKWDFDYNDPKYDEKQKAFSQKLDDTKNDSYRKYFSILKKDYSQTETSKKLIGSCSYYSYFLMK